MDRNEMDFGQDGGKLDDLVAACSALAAAMEAAPSVSPEEFKHMRFPLVVEEEELEQEPGWTMPERADFPNMADGIGRLATAVAKRNQRSAGTFSFAYRGGKWIEVSHWEGDRLTWVVPKDTRITERSLDDAIKAVEEWEG